MNRQIGVGDSKYVIVFDPLLTGHVIQLMRRCIVNRQIRVGNSKNVIVFDPLLTGHVIRRMRSGRVRIYNGRPNQWETLSLITQERIGVGASNLVGIIIDVGVDACGILSRSVGQTNRK